MPGLIISLLRILSMRGNSFAVPVLLEVRARLRVERKTLLHLARPRLLWFAVVYLNILDLR